jgi:hypothetical protein
VRGWETPRASFIPAQDNVLGSPTKSPISAESAIHEPIAELAAKERKGHKVNGIGPFLCVLCDLLWLRRTSAIASHPSSFRPPASHSASAPVMKQAVGLQPSNYGTMNPGRCHWAGMNQAFGLRSARSSPAAAVLRELAFLPFPGVRAAYAGAQWPVGVRQVHSHQDGAVRLCLPRLEEPFPSAHNHSNPVGHARRD